MVQHPNVQAKAQAELDAIIGKGQLPTFGIEASLPYLAAVLKECMRWQPVAPIAVPRQLSVADEYRGYHLPVGAIVICNSW